MSPMSAIMRETGCHFLLDTAGLKRCLKDLFSFCRRRALFETIELISGSLPNRYLPHRGGLPPSQVSVKNVKSQVFPAFQHTQQRGKSSL